MKTPTLVALVVAAWCSIVSAAPAPPPAAAESPVVFGFERVDVSAKHPAISTGEMLVGEFNCVACHAADPAAVKRLESKEPPLLGEVGKRVSPEYLRAFVASPHRTKPGTPMPDLFHGYDEAERTAAVDDLVHYLVSLGGPMKVATVKANKDGKLPTLSKGDVEKGRTHYHSVGCVACHAPQDGPAKVFPPDLGGPEPKADGATADRVPEMKHPSVPLGNLAAKTEIQPLAEFLQNPVHVRPGGRMPSLKLTGEEARYIATYLLRDKPLVIAEDAPPPFKVDKEKAARGLKAFGAVGCASCHRLEHGKPPAPSQVKARPLAELVGTAKGGCVHPEPTKNVPQFKLTEPQRTAIGQALGRVKELKAPLDAKAQAVRTMAVLNCFACHSRGELGGPEVGRGDYFRSNGRADMGTEGQVPPHLDKVGVKLRNDWMHAVLADGAAVRPYMATRMPQFGRGNVVRLPELFEQADGSPDKPSHDVEVTEATVAAGRQMVGTENGFGCVNCHTTSGAPSLGIPGIDLATTTQRLKHEWFHAFLHDPNSYRQGTRMPTFWPDGTSALPNVLGGDERRQQDAIWAYLSLGNRMLLPPGVTGGGQEELTPVREPIVFRTFLKGAGAHAITVGFPERTHVAFDGWNCRMAVAWRGRFINTKSTWDGRAGNPADPAGGDVITFAPGVPFARLADAGAAWPDGDGKAAGYRMLGYRLDKQRRPTFLYEYNGARIEEHPVPVNTAAAGGLVRQFAVEPGGGGRLWFRAAVGDKIEAKGGAFVVDGKQTVRLTLPDGAEAKVRPAAKGQELVVALPEKSPAGGKVSFKVEVLW